MNNLLASMKYRKVKSFVNILCVFLFIVGTIPSLLLTQPVAAADETVNCDEMFYSSNDILFYNPCDTVCGESAGGSAIGDISAVRGVNNGEKIFNYWLDAGMTAQQAAGITGSIQHESGFSPFRQEVSQTWPAGGWGIAQFTHDPGQRGYAIEYVRNAIGVDLFNEYYQNKYGGPVSQANGYIPDGISVEVNDKFLLAQLNYLQDHIKELKPNNVRRDLYQRDFNQIVSPDVTLYNYLKQVVQAGDAAAAWTYLYEFPGDIKKTALGRASSAADILGLYGNGIATTCGGSLSVGGMTLEQAIKFVDDYKNTPSNVQYLGGAGQGCPGGPMSNCVSFSVFFINKHTTLQGFTSGAPGNGSTVASNVISRNPTVQNGHSPRPYAIFSTPSGSEMCGSVKCGHTGIILGVDTKPSPGFPDGKVIVGEAACGAPASWDTAREYSLKVFDSDKYTYAYTDGFLKDGFQ